MWSLYVSLAGLVLSGGLALVFGFNRSKLAKELGEARGEILSLQLQLLESRQEREAMRVALDHALSPPPTLDDLDRVSAISAGSAAAPGAADAIDVP